VSVDDALERCRHLVCERDEARTNRLATDVLATYALFDEAARATFFDGLVDRFSIDTVALQRAAESYLRDPGDDALRALQRAGEPPRRELFFRLAGSSAGTAWLVRMREHLQNHRPWASIEGDLTAVLRVLFNRAVLDFRQIDLETPSFVLERLIKAEAVH